MSRIQRWGLSLGLGEVGVRERDKRNFNMGDPDSISVYVPMA